MRVLASYLLSIYIPTAQATSAIVNPHQNSYDNSLSVEPSASPIPRFRLQKGLLHRPNAAEDTLVEHSSSTDLHLSSSSSLLSSFTSLLFSSLTFYLPNSFSPKKNSFLIFLTTFPWLLPEGSLESQRLSMQLLHTDIS